MKSHKEVELITRARAPLAAPEAVGVADEKIVATYRVAYSSAPVSSCEQRHINGLRAVLARYGTHPAPVPVGERLPELRRAFEHVLNQARCLEARTVGNIELADRLLDAVVEWAPPEAHP
jgi:hypothetical protein